MPAWPSYPGRPGPMKIPPLQRALSGRWVTPHSGHIGNTFRHLRGDANAVAGVLQDGRTAALCGSVARGGEDGGAVPGVRYLPQDRLQDLLALPGLRY